MPKGPKRMERFQTARDVAYALRPDRPVYCFRPAVLAADARTFIEAFPGKTAYAVKTNSERMVLETLAEVGIDCFDVASPAEFAAVRAVAAEGRAALHPPGQGAVGHPPGARGLPHPRARSRP